MGRRHLVIRLRALLRGWLAVAAVGAVLWPGAAPGQELRVLTSMPKSLFEPFARAFEAANPGTSVLVLNKNTNAGVEEIVRGNPRGFDIFWVSAPEAFAVLNAHGAFRKSREGTGEAWRPSPRGGAAFYPFALSSIGWAQRRASYLPQPVEWDDLLRPVYAGKIAMTRPSRSGTTHMFVERFLQVRGWEGGWAWLLALSGNLTTLTSRSFGVVDGVEKGRFEIGITIDFLALSRAENGLSFRYGRPVMVMPAQIGILKGGASPDLAVRFVRFVLSPEGQRLLLRPEIRRVPILPELRASADDPGFAEIENALRLRWQPYDALLARDRYWAVNALFDVFITFQLPRRQQAWRRLRALRGLERPEMAARLAEVERLLTAMPVAETEAIAPGLNAVPTRITAFSAPTPAQRQALERWTAAAEELLAQADALLQELERETEGAR